MKRSFISAKAVWPPFDDEIAAVVCCWGHSWRMGVPGPRANSVIEEWKDDHGPPPLDTSTGSTLLSVFESAMFQFKSTYSNWSTITTNYTTLNKAHHTRGSERRQN